MAITIISPKSAYVDNKNSSTYTLQWKSDISGQTGYEILYKKKTASEWSTLGKVTSTATSFDLRNIYKVTNIDIEEYYYRVMLYYSGDDYTGTEYSDVYSIIFNEGYECKLNVNMPDGIHKYPLLSNIKNEEISFMEVQSNGIKKLPLIEPNHPLADGVKFQTSGGVKQFASNTPHI